jgi:hypothetical protein
MHGGDKKEEHGERKCRVSKVVLQGLGTNESSEQMKQCTSFLKSKYQKQAAAEILEDCE